MSLRLLQGEVRWGAFGDRAGMSPTGQWGTGQRMLGAHSRLGFTQTKNPHPASPFRRGRRRGGTEGAAGWMGPSPCYRGRLGGGVLGSGDGGPRRPVSMVKTPSGLCITSWLVKRTTR